MKLYLWTDRTRMMGCAGPTGEENTLMDQNWEQPNGAHIEKKAERKSCIVETLGCSNSFKSYIFLRAYKTFAFH
jgi:hypothetical protein